MKKALAIVLIMIVAFSFTGCSLIQSTLDTPTNVSIKGNTLKWNSVEGAKSYLVMIDYDEYTTSTNSFDLTTADVEIGQEYSIQVKAKGDGYLKLSSEFSSPIKWVATVNGGGSNDGGSISSPENLEDVNDQSLASTLFETGLGLGVNALEANSAVGGERKASVFRDDAFDNTDIGSYRVGSTRTEATSKEDISSIVEEYNSKLVLGLSAGVGYAGMFTAGFKTKFSIDKNISSSQKQNQFYYIINHYYTGKNYQIKEYQITEDFQNKLSDSFISALEKVQDGSMSPETFFTRYGTHLVMAVSYGGMLEVCYSSFSTESINTSKLAQALSTDLQAAVSYGLGSVSTGFNTSVNYETMEGITTGEHRSCLHIEAIGGDESALKVLDFSTLAGSYSAWVASLSNVNKHRITDVADGGLVPVWDYMPEEYEEAKAILMEYFEQQAKEKADSLAAEMEADKIGDTVNFAGGHGTEESPYLISTAEHFRNINDGLDKHYKLMNDIDLGSSWTPMGTYVWDHYNANDVISNPFKGTLDGDGHKITYGTTISGLIAHKDYGWGLFGTASNATFINLKIRANVYSNNESENCRELSAGGLVGFAEDCTFNNCEVVSGSSVRNYGTDETYYVFLTGMAYTGNSFTGGLVGDARWCSFNNCRNYATVYTFGYQAYSGGIAGSAYNCESLNCSSSYTVTSTHGPWEWGERSPGVNSKNTEYTSSDVFGKTNDYWIRSGNGDASHSNIT